MSVTRARDLAQGALLSLSLLLAQALAHGAEGTTAQCASAYESAQLLRQRGKLLAAREQAAVCAREQCPEIARRDCARWAEELGREIPSVVIVVRDEADRDIPAHRLLVDGVPRVEVGSGRAFELDPGAHVVRVERATAPPVEQSVTVYQGERDRILRIIVPSASASSVVVPPITGASAPRAAPSERPSYALAAVVAGVSLASFGASAYLGLTGRQQLSDLRTSCAPTCTDAQVDPVKTRLTLSDATLGVGLVGGALAAYLFARTASERASLPGAHVEVAPLRDGAAAFVGGRF